MSQRFDTVLFDLDGTLLDTAPDLANALNAVLESNGRAPLPFERIRPVVSNGGAALIQLGFGLDATHVDFPPLRQQFLDHYQQHLAEHTRLFPGMEDVLLHIETQGLTWGVVTNKPAWLTDPLLEALQLDKRAAGIVSGDTVKQCKPHPAPLLHACKLIGSTPQRCLFVGDALRDIQAGLSARMSTLVALFGYIVEADCPESWGADALIETPQEILPWLK
ncbi:MAG: phosphoglycolate phosphatase [Thiogranum sp.]|nr:phosphoglycolate phosphatase [Thiogranum sp.]